MKKPFPLSFLFFFLVAPLSNAAVEKAYTRHYTEDELRTLSEYWSGNDGAIYRTRLTTDPQSITGQYFVVRVPAEASGAESVELTVIRNDGPDPHTHSFALDGVSMSGWLYLGLTGDTWSGSELEPLAWRVRFLTADEAVLAEWKSFLWEMP